MMNIYQHLLFLIPICFLFWFGVIRFNKENNSYNFDKTYPLLSGISAGVSILLMALYWNMNKELPIRLYNWLGTL